MWENVLRNFRDPKTFAVGCKLHSGSNTRPDVVSGHSCTGFTRTLIIATANGCIRVSRKKAWNASEWETSDANALVRSMRVIDRCVPQLLYTPLPVNTIVRTPIYCVSCVVSFSGILYSRAHLRKRRFWKRFFLCVLLQRHVISVHSALDSNVPWYRLCEHIILLSCTGKAELPCLDLSHM